MQSLWGYLKDTCLTAQDRLKKYKVIPYADIKEVGKEMVLTK